MMYNRYVPQSDGTFRRNRMPDQSQPRQEPPRREAPVPPCPPVQEPAPPPCPPPKRQPQRQNPNQQRRRPEPTPPPRDNSAMGFLRQLLPKDLDTGDLLIIVLLLLMAGDCQEDKNTMLLTLALYLFM